MFLNPSYRQPKSCLLSLSLSFESPLFIWHLPVSWLLELLDLISCWAWDSLFIFLFLPMNFWANKNNVYPNIYNIYLRNCYYYIFCSGDMLEYARDFRTYCLALCSVASDSILNKIEVYPIDKSRVRQARTRVVILLHEVALPGLVSFLRSLHGPREQLTSSHQVHQPASRKKEGTERKAKLRKCPRGCYITPMFAYILFEFNYWATPICKEGWGNVVFILSGHLAHLKTRGVAPWILEDSRKPPLHGRCKGTWNTHLPSGCLSPVAELVVYTTCGLTWLK